MPRKSRHCVFSDKSPLVKGGSNGILCFMGGGGEIRVRRAKSSGSSDSQRRFGGNQGESNAFGERNRPKKSILSIQRHRPNVKIIQCLGANSWFQNLWVAWSCCSLRLNPLMGICEIGTYMGLQDWRDRFEEDSERRPTHQTWCSPECSRWSQYRQSSSHKTAQPRRSRNAFR